MTLTITDLENVQSKLGDEYRVELIGEKLILRELSSYESSEVACRLAACLGSWIESTRLGRITCFSTFILTDSNIRTADVSFVRAERLRRAPRSFAELAPDLMVEVKSPSDSVEQLELKINNFLQQGTQIGILINPDDRTVRIFQIGQDVITLRDGDDLIIPELLPGWSFAVSELWSPIF